MFPQLFSPLQIGPVRLKNRVVSTGHDTMMAAGGAVTDRLVAYHAARAAGGAGLIIVQVAGVDDSARYTSHALMAHDDACIPGYERLASVMHEHGCAAFGQLFHGGREVMDTEDGSLGVAFAPSAVPNERFRVLPRAMSTELVYRVIDGFGAAAARLRAAGMDGVEVVASHGYLPAQFLNPHVNLRTDEFGGSAENRLRFLRMVLDSIRERTGGGTALGLRVSMGEESHEGMSQDEVLHVLGELDRSSLFDYVSVVAGSSATLAGSDHIVPPMYYEAGYLAPLAAKVKAHVDVPVMVAGRVNAPQEAERLLETGQADAIGMTRAMICDPTMPQLAESGELDNIRACIGCNQACIGHFHAGHPISCIQHPETGREQVYGIRTPAKNAREVMVIGGGPGGLKAAAVAAERGHTVTLYERARRVGGQVLLAEQLPGRSEFGGAVTNLHGEAQRAGVKIVTGIDVDEAFVRDRAPDAVVIATGAVPRRPEFDFTDDAVTVLDAWQVITGTIPPSGRVVVVDWRADWIGLGVATLLAGRGRAVTLATTGYQAGEALQQYVRDEMLKQALQAGVQMAPLTRLYGADDDTVYLQNVLTGEPVLVPDASGVVLALGHHPLTQLADELAAAEDAPEVHLVGDCLSPRSVEEAVLEGLKVGTAL